MKKIYKNTINIENSNTSHTKIVNEIKDSANVLDVGCAGGYIGEYLFKERNCTIVGIDYNSGHLDTAKETNAYKSLHQIDLNNLTNELDEYVGFFDYIIAADVIEHLYSPDKIIEKLKRFLKDDGCLLFSIPNIAHISIKLNLLDNKFIYTVEGLLDSTHIRFFTLSSIINLMTKLKLEIAMLNCVICYVNHTEQQVRLNKYPNNVIRFVERDPESYIYQYILKVNKSDLENKELLDKNTGFAENELKKVNKQLKKMKIKQIIIAPERFIRKKLINKFRKKYKENNGQK